MSPPKKKYCVNNKRLRDNNNSLNNNDFIDFDLQEKDEKNVYIINTKKINNVYGEFLKGTVSKNFTVEKLIFMAKTSEKTEIINQVIEIIFELNLSNKKVFKFLEEISISYENIDLRLRAIEVLIEIFPEESRNLITWLIEKETNYQVINKLNRCFQNKNQNNLKDTKEKFENKTANLYLKIKSYILYLYDKFSRIIRIDYTIKKGTLPKGNIHILEKFDNEIEINMKELIQEKNIYFQEDHYKKFNEQKIIKSLKKRIGGLMIPFETEGKIIYLRNYKLPAKIKKNYFDLSYLLIRFFLLKDSNLNIFNDIEIRTRKRIYNHNLLFRQVKNLHESLSKEFQNLKLIPISISSQRQIYWKSLNRNSKIFWESFLMACLEGLQDINLNRIDFLE